jgi:multicomponent K+:H+ antiporter subunit G
MIELLVSALLVIGSFFLVVGAIGLVRLPDFFMRLHAPTKASTLGVGSMLLAAVVQSIDGGLSLREFLVSLFLFFTAPLSAHLLAKAALQLRLDSRAPLPDETQAPQDPK